MVKGMFGNLETIKKMKKQKDAQAGSFQNAIDTGLSAANSIAQNIRNDKSPEAVEARRQGTMQIAQQPPVQIAKPAPGSLMGSPTNRSAAIEALRASAMNAQMGAGNSQAMLASQQPTQNNRVNPPQNRILGINRPPLQGVENQLGMGNPLQKFGGLKNTLNKDRGQSLQQVMQTGRNIPKPMPSRPMGEVGQNLINQVENTSENQQQEMSSPEQANMQQSPEESGQDNSSIDQQIAALQAQIAQLQAQKK